MDQMTALEKLLTDHKAGLVRFVYFTIATLATFLVLFHLYVGMFGPPPGYVFKTVHLGAAQILVFLVFPLRREWKQKQIDKFFALDMICAFITAFITIYILIYYETWHLKIAHLSTLDFVLGCCLILLVWEGTRRTIGLPMVIVSMFFFLDAVYTDKFFGIFYGPPHSWEYVITVLFVEEAGIFGIPIAVMAAYVILFLIFASLLLNTGAGRFFTQLAFGMFGHRTGGPAKAAVVSSALMGTLSGSAIGNVVTTGSFTIPLMKRMRYSPEFAGGVEATASTGGQFMPPIMGAVAFIMAEFLGVPYVKVAIAAAIPAILYFSAVFAVVHLRAIKMEVRTVPKQYLPDTKKILLKYGYLAFPLILIIIVLALGYSIIFVAMAAIVSTFLLSFVRRATRLTPLRLMTAMETSIRNAIPLTMTCACAGIIIGSVFITGLSWRLSYIIIDISMGQLWIVLLFTMVLSIILGMGLTTSAVYITLVAIIIPVLVEMGVTPMGAHLFSLYYGILSCITPPVALAAYAAAGVAKSEPMKTGFEATRIGLVGFFVPFLFVYGPELLMIGKPLAIVVAFGTGLLGCISMAAALEGWLSRKAIWFERLMLFAAAIFLLKAGMYSDIIGIALFGSVFLLQRKVTFQFMPQEATEVSRPKARTMLRNVISKFSASHPQMKLEKDQIHSDNQGDDSDLLQFLQDDSPVEGRQTSLEEGGIWRNYFVWGVLSLVIAVFFVFGKYNLHILYLRLWLACLLIASVAIISTFWLLFLRTKS
jgi:TRAP transporter 4TM/12TM fusion protein